ncbi:MAG: hypothetical protein DRQ47_10925, partial [Gammaproteobacteria bacterium]
EEFQLTVGRAGVFTYEYGYSTGTVAYGSIAPSTFMGATITALNVENDSKTLLGFSLSSVVHSGYLEMFIFGQYFTSDRANASGMFFIDANMHDNMAAVYNTTIPVSLRAI